MIRARVQQRLVWLAVLGFGCALERRPPKPVADLVVRHAAIYTMSSPRTWAQALAVRDGRLMYVGTDSGVAAYMSGGTKVFDLPGRMVLPGLHDSHVHLMSGGLELGECNLYDLHTPAQVDSAIRASPGPGVGSRERLAASGLSAGQSHPAAARRGGARSARSVLFG